MTDPIVRPVCDWSQLHVDECAHCHGGPGVSVVGIGTIERYLQRPAPEYRYREREWRVPAPEPTACAHRRDGLCGDCDHLLNDLLYDLPELVHQLGVAMRKDTRFRPHGHRLGDVEHPDEATIPWNPGPAGVLTELQQLMAGRVWTRNTDGDGWALTPLDVRNPANRRALLEHMSRLATRAHHVIDRPRDREYSMCPRCRTEIVVEDHTLVVCPNPECTYLATWGNHQTDLLDANGDAMLTAEEIRFILDQSGEPITRQRIHYLVARHGLPREEIVRPSWAADRRLVTKPQYVYRLRDVRDLQAKLARA